MTRFLLVRHGSTDAVGRRLVGRAEGVPLNDDGWLEAKALGAYLAGRSIDEIHSSPLERAEATATAIAAPHALRVTIQEALTDCDFGAWTGKSFEELASSPEFQRFNTRRSGTRPPGGEHVFEVQTRMVAVLERIARLHPQATVAVVSHADPLRAAIGFFLGMPIDLLGRMEIDTGSVTELALDVHQATLLTLNHRPHSHATCMGGNQSERNDGCPR